jgi:hypothetical protein
LELGNLLWSPTLEPIFLKSGARVPGKAVVRPDNGAVLGTVSDTFRVHPHAEFFSRLIDGLDGSVRISAVTGLHEGSIVTLSAEIVGGEFEVSKDDVVKRFLNAWTGHTGKLASSIQLDSKTRIVCANTLAAAQAGGAAFSGKVKHSQHSLPALENLIAEVHSRRDDTTTAELYRAMRSKPIGDLGFSQYVASVFQTEKPKELPAWQKLEALWNGEAKGAELAGQSVWGAYNVETEFASHFSGRTKDNEKATVSRMLSNAFGSGADMIERAEDQARILTLA